MVKRGGGGSVLGQWAPWQHRPEHGVIASIVCGNLSTILRTITIIYFIENIIISNNVVIQLNIYGKYINMEIAWPQILLSLITNTLNTKCYCYCIKKMDNK